MNKNYSARDLTKLVLLVSAVGILIPAFAISPGLGYALKFFLKDKKYHPTRINQTLKRLESQKMIAIREEKGNVNITLLERGKKKVLSYKIDELILNQGKWDGLWRVVIFDIPEKKRSARDFLRSKLKEIGFYKLQKSVLVTPWECRDIVDFVKHFYGVEDYVNLIIAKKFQDDDRVRSYFGLH